MKKITKISDQKKPDNYIQKFLERTLKTTYRQGQQMFEAEKYFLLTSVDVNFRTDRIQRMIILESVY